MHNLYKFLSEKKINDQNVTTIPQNSLEQPHIYEQEHVAKGLL